MVDADFEEVDFPLVAKFLEASGFSAEQYRALNPDVAQVCPTDEYSIAHFIRSGVLESRPASLKINRSDLVDLWRRCQSQDFCSVGCGLLKIAIRSHIEQHGLLDAIESYALVDDFPVTTIIVIGDSHANAYDMPFIRNGKIIVPFVMVCTAGSAIGLANSNSRAGYGERIAGFLKYMRQISALDHVPIVFKFGQVDTEFVLNFKRAQNGDVAFIEDDCHRFFERSVASYISFVSSVVPFDRRMYSDVASIFPPVLSDAAIGSGYFNDEIASREGVTDSAVREILRQLEYPDWSTRIRLHATYNKLLRYKAENAGLYFVDDFSPVLGGDGFPMPRFWEPHGGADHHLCRYPGETVYKNTLYDRILARRDSSVNRISENDRRVDV